MKSASYLVTWNKNALTAISLKAFLFLELKAVQTISGSPPPSTPWSGDRGFNMHRPAGDWPQPLEPPHPVTTSTKYDKEQKISLFWFHFKLFIFGIRDISFYVLSILIYIINIDNWQVHNQSRRWWVRRPQCRSQPPRATQSPAEQEGTETVCCERLGIENKYSIWILLKHKKNYHSAIYEVVLRGNAWLL